MEEGRGKERAADEAADEALDEDSGNARNRG